MDSTGPVRKLVGDSLTALSPCATSARVSRSDIDVAGDKLCDNPPPTSCTLDEGEVGGVLSVGGCVQEHSGKSSPIEKSGHSDMPLVELCASRSSHARQRPLLGSSLWLDGASDSFG